MKQDAQDVSSTPHDAEPVQDAQDSREPTLGSLRWACDEQDWLACAAQAGALGSIGGADIDAWDMTL